MLDGPMRIILPNFIKINQMVVELSHLTVFKMGTFRHLGFLI